MSSVAKSFVLGAFLASAAFSFAVPSFVSHNPISGVFGESGSVTQRNPSVPREGESTDIWIKNGPSFSYNRVAVYYTTDGSTPAGSFGTPSGTTQVLLSNSAGVNFVRNEPRSGGGNDDWWKATLPVSTRNYAATIKYKITSWDTASGPEVTASDPNTGPIFQYTNRIAWPGAGNGQANPQVGYPPVKFWKEEAVIGNQFINLMLDQNGTIYDIYYPGAGAVNGVSTKNEGYSGGFDTFPAGLPLDHRGQMHTNQIMTGIRVNGMTHWLSNPNGVSFSNITQSYETDTNTVKTNSKLTAGGNDIDVTQYDFSPIGVSFPTNAGGGQQKGIAVKRTILKNNTNVTQTVSMYLYADWAINGGDNYDVMNIDAQRNAMTAVDNTSRNVSATGNFIPFGNEYNPSTFGSYNKSVSLAFGAAMKVLPSVGSAGGTWSNENWRMSSGDNSQGWIATKFVLQPGVPLEVNTVIAAGFDNFPNATGTYSYQVAPILDWFQSQNMSQVQANTNTYWQNWLNEGVTIDLPDNRYDALWNRSKLATALHIDGKSGSIIAGMHNGAYPYVWPRDTMYAAISLYRSGHWPEGKAAIDWMKNTAFRGNESWGKGFFYQKYTTDGYQIWTAPQVDETSALPWAVWYGYETTGDVANSLTPYWQMVRDSAIASSSDSALDSRLFYDETFNLVSSMNIWEDQFAPHIYSNASVYRGLIDAAKIAERLGYPSEQSDFNNRATNIFNGTRGRLAWNGENTDISQIGIVYPFDMVVPTDPDAVRVMDRINGVAGDNTGAIKPLVNFSGEFQDLINRYFGDSYWNGGPWWLSTLWYGLYYAERADWTPGRGDISNHKLRIDKLYPFLGNMSMGAEQISPSSAEHHPGFKLQTAWPNVWESMSTYMDSIMAFLDFKPDARNNTLRISPKLPNGWNTMLFKNVELGAHAYDVSIGENARFQQVAIKNKLGGASNFDVWMKIPTKATVQRVTVNGVPSGFLRDQTSNRVRVQGAVRTGTNATTAIKVEFGDATPVSGSDIIREPGVRP
jgi:hypothetical protein